jgi:hypothetical protein
MCSTDPRLKRPVTPQQPHVHAYKTQNRQTAFRSTYLPVLALQHPYLQHSIARRRACLSRARLGSPLPRRLLWDTDQLLSETIGLFSFLHIGSKLRAVQGIAAASLSPRVATSNMPVSRIDSSQQLFVSTKSLFAYVIQVSWIGFCAQVRTSPNPSHGDAAASTFPSKRV